MSSGAHETDGFDVGIGETHDDPQERGLAGAVRPEDGVDPSLSDGQGNAAKRLLRAEPP